MPLISYLITIQWAQAYLMVTRIEILVGSFSIDYFRESYSVGCETHNHMGGNFSYNSVLYIPFYLFFDLVAWRFRSEKLVAWTWEPRFGHVELISSTAFGFGPLDLCWNAKVVAMYSIIFVLLCIPWRN